MGPEKSASVPDIIVRQGRERDLEAAHRLGVVSLASDAWSFESFCREVAAPHARFHVVEVPGCGVVAYVLWWLVVDEGTIVQVATDPDWRRRGMARALLRQVLDELCSAGARRCYLEVRRLRTPAIRLYEALGFRVEAVRKGYYQDPGDDALVMSLEVESIR